MNANYKILNYTLAFIALYLAWIGLNSLGLIELAPKCIIKSKLGFECFGCGTTRGISQLFQGNIKASIHQNPLAIILLISFILILTRQTKRLTQMKI